MTETKDDRLTQAEERSRDFTSLIGSFFHAGPEPGWQGCVVAEPAPGIYLVETFSWVMGESHSQHLVPITRMVDEDWWFYDTAEWMNNTYTGGLDQKWEKQRAEQAK